MLLTNILRSRRRGQEGGALVFALIVVMMATLFTASILQLTSSASKRQAAAVDELRAFYIAEAGLSESFEALRVGKRGQVGSIDAPSRFGDGFVWVDVVPIDDGQLRLESTAICGRGRTTLAVIVEPVEVPLGIFSDESLVVETALLVDGFDSSEGEEETSGEITVDPASPNLHVDPENSLVFYEGAFYHFTSFEGNTYSYDHSISVAELSEDPAYGPESMWEIDPGDFSDQDLMSDELFSQFWNGSGWDPGYWELMDQSYGGLHPDFLDFEYTGVQLYFTQVLQDDPSSLPLSSDLIDLDGIVDELLETMRVDVDLLGGGLLDTGLVDSESLVQDVPSTETATGDVAEELAGAELDAPRGLLGSNGNVTIGGAGEEVSIQGDVVPGADGTVFLSEGGSVSGSMDPRRENVELPAVEIPALEMEPGVIHSGAFPLILSPGEIGIDSIDVASDAEVILRGPATVVLGSLNLSSGASLSLDTTDGNVELFITDSLNLSPGAVVKTSGDRPDEISLQISARDAVGGEAPVQLKATSQFYGTIYAPQAEVVVGSDFEVWGGVVARVLDLEPGAKLHYDAGSASAMPCLVSWNIIEIPAAISHQLVSSMGAFDQSALPALHESHDLGGIGLHITYVDVHGAEQSYSGPEEDFSWSEVAEVVRQERTGREDWESGWWSNWDSSAIVQALTDLFNSWGSNWGTGWGEG